MIKTLLKSAFALVGFAGVFTGGFVWRDVWAHRPPSLTALHALVDPKSARHQTPTELFQSQFNKIQSEASVSVRADKLKYAAMAGMFESLGDPHTLFMEPADAETFNMDTRGDFVGIGARLGSDPSGARVAVVFKGSPAERAGIKVGDTIIEVEGRSTTGQDTDDVVKQIRGKEGTPVRIKVLRDKVAGQLNFTIRRALVTLPTAEGRMLPGLPIAYITITGFAQPTPSQLDAAMVEVLAQKPEGIILDLRGNPGGLLDVAADMLGRFVENKVVVIQRKRGGGESRTFTPFGKVKQVSCPLVILINEDSASAAEIFSGVLQEYGRATLVGEHSYGKSSVQTVKNLVDFSSAKITIAKYLLPSGRDIGRKLDEDGEYVSGGLKPDVQVSVDFEKDTQIGDPAADSQLRKAVEVVRAKSGR